MQGRSLSKQHRPQQQQMMGAYQEASGQQFNIPTSQSARKYTPVGTTASGSTQKLTAPIKQLQQKHKHLEQQLANLRAEVSNQHIREREQQHDAEMRRKYIKPASGAPQVNYQSPLDRPQGHLPVTGKVRIQKDRSNSGQKRFKQGGNHANNMKVTSPQRSEKLMLGSQSSASKLERQKQITDILGHLKKNSQGQVVVKMSTRGVKNNTNSQNYIGLGGKSHSIGNTPVTAIADQKSGTNRGVQGSRGNRPYYAGTDKGINEANHIDLTSQQHNMSVSNGSSRINTFSNTVAGIAQQQQHQQPQTTESDLNQQLINLQGNTAAIVTPSGQNEEDTILGNDFDDAAMTPVSRQPMRAASGPRYPISNQSHLMKNYDAPQPYNNMIRNQITSPDRSDIAAQNSMYYHRNSQPQTNNFVNDSGNIQTHDLAIQSSIVGYQQQSQNQAAGGSDIVRNLESGILSLHSHLKTLEGKYIDLANYYKQELIQSAQPDENSSSIGPGGQARPASSSTYQRKLQGSAKRTASRESSQLQQRSKNNLDGQQSNKRTPRLEGRSNSKSGGVTNGIRNYEEYKDSASNFKRNQIQRGKGLDQAQERSIIEEVKSQKLKLENEMRNLINLYSQMCEEDVKGSSQATLHPFQSRYSTNTDEQNKHQRNETLNRILLRYQNHLMQQSQYQGSNTVKTFDELFEELSEFVTDTVNECRKQNVKAMGQVGKLPSLSIMERIEKLGGDYDIQQEYSLSNLKETMFQIQHANEQFSLDLKKIGLDFSAIQKKIQNQERGLINQLQDSQDEQLSLDDYFGGIEQVSNGLNSLSKRVQSNEQKLSVLAENHGESVRYLREYRENLKQISNDYALWAQQSAGATIGDVNGDQVSSVNQSYHGAGGSNSKYQAEITSLNQEIFQLRTHLAEAKQNGLFDLNELRDKLDLLNSENASLHGKVGDMNNQLTHREAQNADLVQQMQSQPSPIQIQNAQILEDFWRQNCQQMVDLAQRFLHSMRRLQKVVHRKESNVQQEKQNFESAKKELESNLKEVKRQLENCPQRFEEGSGMMNPSPLLGDIKGQSASTSARPFVPMSHEQFNQGANHAQSMRVHQSSHGFTTPGQPIRPPFNLDSALDPQQHSLQKQSTEQSIVPQKQLNSGADLELLQKQITELKNENVKTSKTLQKERQKVQNLLTELKMSQENLQKVRLTFVPQENVSELESSVKQLQETIKEHENQDQMHSKMVQELKMTINDKQMNIYELTRLANENQNQAKPDFKGFIKSVSEQANEVISGQASWLQSIEQHILNKEQQMAQMVETIQQISRIMAEKNENIRALMTENENICAENQQIYAEMRDKDDMLNSKQTEAGEQTTQLKSEVSKLRGDLNIKTNGNRMMNALMRGFKNKLDEEMARSRKVIKDQTQEIQQFSQVVQQQNKQFDILSNKLEKKKFKSTETKKNFASQQQQMQVLQSKIEKKKFKSLESKKMMANKEQEMQQLQSKLQNQQNSQQQQIKVLQSKIEKKKFKSSESKTLMANKEQEMQQLQSKLQNQQNQMSESKRLMSSSEQQMSHQMNELQTKFQNTQNEIVQQNQAKEEHLKAQVSKLSSDLHVKKSGNLMMNALMRGLKQKLDEEMIKNREVIQLQSEEITQYEEMVQQQNQQVETLSSKIQKKKLKQTENKKVMATRSHQMKELQSQVQTLNTKIEKKKFKQQEAKKILSSNSQEMNQLQSKLVQDNQELEKRSQLFSQLQQENQQLKGSLNVKKNGNLMMNALMRGLKQKLDEEKVKQDQLIQKQQSEIKQFTHQVQMSENQVKILHAKVEKKKFKSGQLKQHTAKVQQDQEAIFGQKRVIEEQLDQVAAEKQTTQDQLKDLQADIIQMQQEHDQERDHLNSKCTNLEDRILQVEAEKDELRQAQQNQLSSLQENEKAKGDRMGETISRLQNELESRASEIQRLEDANRSLKSQTHQQTDDQQSLRQQHQKDLEEAREKQARQTLESATVEQLDEANNQAAMFEIKELRIENQQQRQINEQRDQQATEYNNKLTESNLQVSQLKNQLESTSNDAKVEKASLSREIDNLNSQLKSTNEKISQLKDELEILNELTEQTELVVAEKEGMVGTLEERIDALQAQHESFKTEQEQVQGALRQDRDTAQAQLSDFVNQNKFEKESLEGKLQHQLNQTLAQLDAREDECEEFRRQINELKETNSQQEIEMRELTVRLDKKKAKMTEMKSSKDGQEEESRGDKAALEQSRELVVQFKAKLQANDDMIAAQEAEIQTLRSKVEQQTAELAEKANQITEHLDDLSTLEGELQSKSEEVTRALTQVDAFQAEVERLNSESSQYKDQISQLKLQFESKASGLESQANSEREKLKEKDELIAEADNLLAEFNNEKHEVKAKFKHLMQLLSMKAAGSQSGEDDEYMDKSSKIVRASNPSSYKGREGEVDLNHCFEELEQIVLDFKARQESRIVELIEDKEQLAGTVHEQKQDLEATQVSLAHLQEKLDEANAQVESNDSEARRQIETAMRKIQNYKEKLAGKKESIVGFETQVAALTAQLAEAQLNPAKLDASDSGMMGESFIALQKENMQLLERLQKTEDKLQKARGGEPIEEEPKQETTKVVALSPEVAAKLDEIDSAMADIQRELHMAKSTCLKELTSKLGEKLKAAQKTFANEELLKKAINADKVTGWNNIVKECRPVSFGEKRFMLVQDVSESTFYLVDLDRVTETATKYLKAFIEDYDDDEWVHDAVGQNAHDLDEGSEIEKLKALVTDLRQDRIELQAELERFREGVKSDTSRIAGLKDEEMKDDIEYLTGENKELHLKVKEVCLTKANLQLQLAQLQKHLRVEEEQRDISAIVAMDNNHIDRLDASAVETARNIDDEMFPPVEELKDESSRMPDRRVDDYSDQDSVADVVNQMDEEEDAISESQYSSAAVVKLRQRLERAEAENDELNQRLLKLQNEASASADKEDDEEGGSLIPHIKVTLIQFLKNVALTDPASEALLGIVINMMEFTDTEIQELKIARLNIKLVKGKPQRAASGSVVRGGNSTNSMSRDEEGVAKPKRGLFGMFGKKKQDANTSGNGNASAGLPPTLKPVARR